MLKKIVIGVLVLVFVFGLGFFTGAKIQARYGLKLTAAGQQNISKLYGNQAAASKSSTGAAGKIVVGQVQKNESGSIDIASELSPSDVLTIHTDGNTKFFQVALSQQDQTKPSSQEEKKEVSLADIKEGEMIRVIAKDNIADKKEVTAIEIDLEPAPALNQ